jgi:hypothetical protein
MDSELERDGRGLEAWPLDGAQGPALTLTESGARDLAQRIVARTLRPRTRTRRRTVSLLAAIVVLGAAAMAGAMSLPRLWQKPSGLPKVGQAAPNQAPVETGVSRSRASLGLAPPFASATAEPPNGASSLHDDSSAPSQGGDLSPLRPTNASKARGDADDLLKLANQLRHQRDWSGAEAAYMKFARQHPRTARAEVAALSAASLRLDHLADPRGALLLYRSLGPGGALDAEAQFGMARCYRVLGDVPGETAALRQVIASGAVGLYAERARDRLGELKADSP